MTAPSVLPSKKRLPPWATFTPLQPALEAARIVGLFEWDFAADRIIPCLGMSRLFGLPRSAVEVGASVADFLPALHPDDRPIFAHRIGRARQDVERLAYRVGQPGAGQARLTECTFYAPDPHGAPGWACGMLFDHAMPAAVSAVPSGHSRSEVVARAARLATELHACAGDLGSPVLKALLDVVLYEIGKTLAEDIRRPGGGRLN